MEIPPTGAAYALLEDAMANDEQSGSVTHDEIDYDFVRKIQIPRRFGPGFTIPSEGSDVNTDQFITYLTPFVSPKEYAVVRDCLDQIVEEVDMRVWTEMREEAKSMIKEGGGKFGRAKKEIEIPPLSLEKAHPEIQHTMRYLLHSIEEKASAESWVEAEHREQLMQLNYKEVHRTMDFLIYAVEERVTEEELQPLREDHLFSSVFELKKRWGGEMNFICGGHDKAVDSTLLSKASGDKIRQVLVGSSFSPPRVRDLSMKTEVSGKILNGRYDYRHKIRVAGATAVKVDAETGISLVAVPALPPAKVVLGPVIGKVQSNSAIIMIEIDSSVLIKCFVEDLNSGERFVRAHQPEALRPYSFVFTGLTAGRKYLVRFEGIDRPQFSRGSFTTLAVDPASLGIVVTAEAFKCAKPGKEAHLKQVWTWLEETVWPDAPYSMMLHLSCGLVTKCLIDQINGVIKSARPEETETCVDLAKDMVRRQFRRALNAASTRRTLSTTPTLLLGGLLPHFPTHAETPEDRKAQGLVCEVVAEYFQKLWSPYSPPIDQASGLREGSRAFHQFGSLGILMLDVLLGTPSHRASERSVLSSSQWLDLATQLRTLLYERPAEVHRRRHTRPVHLLLVVTECLVVGGTTNYCKANKKYWSHHPEDAYQLLSLLFEWKSESKGIGRNFVLVGAGGFQAQKTHIFDEVTKLTAEQWQVPNISNQSKDSLLMNGKLGSRFSFTHEKSLIPEGSFLYLQAVPDPVLPTVQVHEGLIPRITMGPIVGEVSLTAVKILIEVSRATEVTISAKPVPPVPDDDDNGVRSGVLQLDAFRPGTLRIDGLQPCTRYLVDYKPYLDAKEKTNCYFRTPASQPPIMRFACVWGHNPGRLVKFKDGGKGPWSYFCKTDNTSCPEAITAAAWAATSPDLLENTFSPRRALYPPAETDLRGLGLPSNPWWLLQDVQRLPHEGVDFLIHLGNQVTCEATINAAELLKGAVRYAPFEPSESDESETKDELSEEVMKALSGLSDLKEGLDDSELDGSNEKSEEEPIYTPEDYTPELKVWPPTETASALKVDSEWDILTNEFECNIRKTYRAAWGMPQAKPTLATASNVMLRAPGDLCDGLLPQPCPKDLKSISDATWEQHQKTLLLEQPLIEDLVSSEEKVQQEGLVSRKSSAKEDSRASSKRPSISDKKNGQSKNASGVEGSTTEGFDEEDVEKLAPIETEGTFRRYSNIGVLCLDVWANLLKNTYEGYKRKRTTSDSGSSLLNDRQWELLSKALDIDSITSMVICLGMPALIGGDYDQVSLATYPTELEKLFKLVFAWMGHSSLGTGKTAAFLCGNSPFPMVSKLIDRSLNQVIFQVCPGPLMSDNLAKCPWPKEGLFAERFAFHHVMLETTPLIEYSQVSLFPSVGFVDIFSEADRSRIDAYLGGQDRFVRKVGPVLGKIDVIKHNPPNRATVTARILVSFDCDAEITCVLTDVLSHEQYRKTCTFKREEARCFVVERLRVNCRYHIGFEGAKEANPKKHFFMTPKEDEYDLNLLVVSGDNQWELAAEETSLWTDLAERTTVPWHLVGLVLHVGGQVVSDASFHDASIFLRKYVDMEERGKGLSLDEKKAVEDAVRCRFRSDYQASWCQPSIQEVLGGVPHLMLRGLKDKPLGSTRYATAFQDYTIPKEHIWADKLAQEVFREFQRQLWDDAWEEDHRHESFYQTWNHGRLGAVFLDLNEPDFPIEEATCGGELPLITEDKPCMSDAQWKVIQKLLAQENLITLMVVTEKPLVWLETKKLKMLWSRMDRHRWLVDQWCYRPRPTGHLLSRLFEWKYQVEGREVIFICGAGEPAVIGFETLIKKDKGNKTKDPDQIIKQVSTGPLTATSHDYQFDEKGKFGKFLFQHGPLIKGRQFTNTTVIEKNFAVVEVCADKDDNGWIGASKSHILTKSYISQLYEDTRFFRLPDWWEEWFLGESEMLINDKIYMMALEDYETNEARDFIDSNQDLTKEMETAYHKFYLADMTRPKKLRTMDINNENILRDMIYSALDYVWDKTPKHVQTKLAFLPDRFVANFILRRTLSDPEPLRSQENFVWFCKDTLHQAAIIRFTLKWINRTEQEERETAFNAKGLEAEAEAEQKRIAESKEAELKAELEQLKKTSLEKYHQRVLELNTEQKYKDEKAAKDEEEKEERERLEAEAKEQAKRKAEEDQEAFEAEKERIAQDELNWLAENDPDEYNSRIQEMLQMSEAKQQKDSENPAEKRYRLALNRHEFRVEPGNTDMLRVPFS